MAEFQHVYVRLFLLQFLGTRYLLDALENVLEGDEFKVLDSDRTRAALKTAEEMKLWIEQHKQEGSFSNSRYFATSTSACSLAWTLLSGERKCWASSTTSKPPNSLSTSGRYCSVR